MPDQNPRLEFDGEQIFMKMDWSKGNSLHRLYGHGTFIREALHGKKNWIFIQNICTNQKCKETKIRLKRKEGIA